VEALPQLGVAAEALEDSAPDLQHRVVLEVVELLLPAVQRVRQGLLDKEILEEIHPVHRVTSQAPVAAGLAQWVEAPLLQHPLVVMAGQG
jgi:hypothetical protein